VGSRGKDTGKDTGTDDGTPHDETAGSKRGRKQTMGEPQPERALAPACAAEDPQAAPLATRQERALALLCQGLRPSAIAQILGTTPGTVRRWLRQRFDGLAREAREEHASALLRAIESQREIARAAWEAYQHERAVEAAALRGELDRVKRRAVRRTGGSRSGRARLAKVDQEANQGEADEDADGEEVLLEEYERPRLPAQGSRYLALAMSAQREMARLQGLYDEIAQQPGQISITITRRPDGPENVPPEERAAPIAAAMFGPVARDVAAAANDEDNDEGDEDEALP
jgi:transposase